MTTMKGTPQQPNPIKVGLHIPIRFEAEADSEVGASGAAPESGGGQELPPMPTETPDPLVRRTPITHKEVENMGPHQDVWGVKQKAEEKLHVADTRRNAGGEWKSSCSRIKKIENN